MKRNAEKLSALQDPFPKRTFATTPLEPHWVHLSDFELRQD